MIQKWLTAQGIWIFIIVVIGGFIVMLLMNNPQSREKQCAEVKDNASYPESERRADESSLDLYNKRREYEKLVERCKQ